MAVVALPQSMAYAIIAGLPVEYGLYASIVPTIIGCLWGSSAHLITGPTTTASLVVFSALSSIARPGSLPYIELAFLLIRVEDIRRALRSTRSDAAVMLVTFLFTVFLNIEFSIYVGVLLSIGLHLAKTSHPRIYSVVPDLATDKMVGFVQGQTCCQMDILQIEGSIFFGSAAFVLKDFQHRLRQTVRGASSHGRPAGGGYCRNRRRWCGHFPRGQLASRCLPPAFG